jgi:uroporphyrin-III C-methyltransferase
MNEPATPSSQPAQAQPAGRNTASGALPVAVIALLVALAGTGYALLREPAAVTTVIERAPAEATELAALGARIDEINAGRRRLEDEISRLAARLDRERREVAMLPARLEQLEGQVRRLAGTDRTRAAWLLAEAEHYLRIANVQLGLASDVPVSRTAMGLADDALRELGDPRLTSVRRLLSAEMAALDRVPRPDIEGVVLTLGSLAESLPTLTLQRPTPDEFRPGRDDADAGLGASERAFAAVRDAFAGLVLVRRTSEPVTPLLGDADLSLLMRSLELELQLARLAIMRGDAGMYRRSLESAIQRLEQHFDPGARDATSTLDTLRELGEIDLPEELPDISGSLSLLTSIIGGMTAPAGPETATDDDAGNADDDNDEALPE